MGEGSPGFNGGLAFRGVGCIVVLMTQTVTVARKGKGYLVSFSALPGRTFGPWAFDEVVRDLQVSALLTPFQARNIVLASHEHAYARYPMSGE
jgi:hypothetical protein